MEALLSQIPDSYLYFAGLICIALFLVYGVVLPLFEEGNFARASAGINPKGQYVFLAIASLVFGLSGKVGAWLATARGWLLDGFGSGLEYTLGIGAGWLIFVVAIVVWIDMIVPGGREPKGRPAEHFTLWLISFMLYPMLASVNPNVSMTMFAGFFIFMWWWNKKHRSGGGGRSMAGAGAGGGRSF
jgi:hypothetical protein